MFVRPGMNNVHEPLAAVLKFLICLSSTVIHPACALCTVVVVVFIAQAWETGMGVMIHDMNRK